jgi:Cdc6-like AAA superfamily ATPase
VALKIFEGVFMVIKDHEKYPRTVQYQSILTLSFIIATKKSRDHIKEFYQQLIAACCSLVTTSTYEKFFDVILKIFTYPIVDSVQTSDRSARTNPTYSPR